MIHVLTLQTEISITIVYVNKGISKKIKMNYAPSVTTNVFPVKILQTNVPIVLTPPEIKIITVNVIQDFSTFKKIKSAKNAIFNAKLVKILPMNAKPVPTILGIKKKIVYVKTPTITIF